MDEINWKDYGVDAESAAFWDKYNAAVEKAAEREKEAHQNWNRTESGSTATTSGFFMPI